MERKKLLIGVLIGALVVMVGLNLVLIARPPAGLEPRVRTLDIKIYHQYAAGEDPLEALLPGAGNLLVTEFYRWRPDVLVAFEGDTIVLNVLNPDDDVHGLAIPAFGVDTGPLVMGERATLRFVADRAGTFLFRCSVPWNPQLGHCTPDHVVQIGHLIILER
jgi:hypothetical protein